MDDFETRLATLLQERAAIARVDDRLDDVRAVPVRPLPSARRGWWLAAAVVVALVAGTVWAVARDDDRHSIRPAVPSVSTAATDWTELPAPPLDPRLSAGSVATDQGWLMWSADVTPNLTYFDPAVGTWRDVPLPLGPSVPIASGVWTGSEVVVTVADHRSVHALDPATMTWREIPISAEALAAWPVAGGTVSRFGDRVLVWGMSDLSLFTHFLLDPATGEWQVLPEAPDTDAWPTPGRGLNRFSHPGNGRWLFEVASSGGSSAKCVATEVRGYDTATGVWQSWIAPSAWSPGALAVTDAGLLFAGIRDCAGGDATGAMLLDTATDTWNTLRVGPGANALGGRDEVAAWPVGESLEFVGRDGAPVRYDLFIDSWWVGSAPPQADVPVTSAVVGSDLYEWMPATADHPNGRVFRTTLPVSETTPSVPDESSGVAWQSFPAPDIAPRFRNVSLGLDNGWFVWGGYPSFEVDPNSNGLTDGAILDAGTGVWRTLPELPAEAGFSGGGASAVWTGNEVVLVQGGVAAPHVVAFDPVLFSWRVVAVPPDIVAAWPRSEGRYGGGSGRMVGARIVWYLPANPEEFDPPAVLLLDLQSGQWTVGAAPPTTMTSLWLGVTASSTQLFVVGAGQTNSMSACLGSTPLYIYDVATDTWAEQTLPHGNWQPTVIAWLGDRLLLAGGNDCEAGLVRRSVLFDPATGLWTDVAEIPTAVPGRYLLSGTPVVEGRAVALDLGLRVVVYDPGSDRWWWGPSPLAEGVNAPRADLVVVGAELRIWSPGISRPLASGDICCYPTGEAYTLTFPDPALWAQADGVTNGSVESSAPSSGP